jgi:site-specific DNA-methyltransferase (adenine-specific)
MEKKTCAIIPSTSAPTLEPTSAPTLEPTSAPTLEPTSAPTLEPISIEEKINKIKSKMNNKNSKKELLDICKQLNIKGCSSKSIQQVKDKINSVLASEPSELFVDNPTQLPQEYTKGNIVLYSGDAIDKLNEVEDKSIQTICIDPPYNIGKDFWDNIENYIEWLTSIICKLETKLKPNGSFFIFHNDMEQIAELIISIKKNTKLIFRQMIVWNKRFENSPKKGFLDGYIVKNDMHNWNKMAEYILFYTFDNSELIKKERIKQNVSQQTISQEIKSKTGGSTGWFSNIETGKNYPTKETMAPITKHLGLKYEDIVPKFNNQKTDHSVWNYDIAKKLSIHITPKPLNLLKNIILHTTDENDTLLDCFAGTGSLGYAARELNRNCILIEKEEKYCDYIITQLNC